MADQTEQEPIDPWKRATARIRGLANNGGEVCPQFTYRNEVPISCERCGYEADVHLVRDLLAARAADAALLRERDEQIATLDAELARLSTHVELVQNEADDLRAQIARLSAQNDALAQEVADLRGKIAGEREC